MKLKVNIFFVFIFSIVLIKCSSLYELKTSQLNKGPEFTPYSGLKSTIAIMDFENYTDQGGKKFGSAISDKLITILARSGRFIIIERQKIQEILQEQALGQSGVITEETAAQVGQLIGVQTIILGNILEVSQETGGHKFNMNDDDDEDKWSLALKATVGHVMLSYRMVNTTTGEIIMANNASATEIRPGFGISTKVFDFVDMFELDQTILGNAVRKAVNKMAVDIVNHAISMEWEGKIVSVKDDSLVYFKPGRNSGVRIGDTFQILGQLDETFNEETEFIKTSVKGSIEVVDFIGELVAKAIILDGHDFNIGDCVKFRETDDDEF